MITFICEHQGTKIHYEVRSDGRPIGGGCVAKNNFQAQVDKYRAKGLETEIVVKS